MTSPSPNIWIRLEPYALSEALEGGLNAAIHDPLWLLGRQWQLGEFQGEDVGSPIYAHLEMTCTPLTRYNPGAIPTPWFNSGIKTVEGQRIDSTMPLELLLESEAIHHEELMQPRLAAEAGLQFRRFLTAFNVAPGESLPDSFALLIPDDISFQAFDADTSRFLQVMAGRVPDGKLLYDLLLIIRGSITASQFQEPYHTRLEKSIQDWKVWATGITNTDSLDLAVTTWLTWYESLFSEPPSSPKSAWIPERLEYEAQVAAPVPEGEIVLATPEYMGNQLDWYSFDFLKSASLSAKRTDLSASDIDHESIKCSAIPVPVSFRGMPATRYWELEDARIDFGAVNAGPQQLVKLLLIEFGLVAGDDWFVLPVMVPVGSLCQTSELIVRDTFGDETLILSARKVDESNLEVGETDLPWDCFGLSLDTRVIATDKQYQTSPDILFLPATLHTCLHGSTLEEVLFLRDEMANMAWAVERVIEGPLGQAINRSEAYFRSKQKIPNVASLTDEGREASLSYRLATEIPDHWIPLFPVRIRIDAPPIRLQRGDKWRGYILKPSLDKDGTAVPIHGEELPREGVKVKRSFQYVRWTDGQTYLWIGRSKNVGRGEGASGLQFDVLLPPNK